ncbi:MAG: two-component sensor histidine kinase, partial [Roseiflexus sp.]|nr:two-component sensor histidine kinase [Roseiflexus sp.]
DRMAQVLNNLVANALRHTSHGEIVLTAREEGAQRIILEVHDTGSGIALEDLPRIFDRFYRADPSRSREGGHQSTGLGLAIAKAIIDAHDGTISVASRRVGEGATFTITLPIVWEQKGRSAPQETPVTVRAGKR